MKQILLLLFAVAFFSCGRKPKPVYLPPPPAPKFFVSGTYVAFEKSSYCRTWDTLCISKVRRQANVYRVIRLTTFQRNLEDDYYSAEKDKSSWVATYDPVETVMRALDDGPNLFFNPRDNALLVADHVFIKIE